MSGLARHSFSSTKRSTLAERGATKTAVKLDRFTYESDGKTVFVNDMTKISVPNSSDCDFQFVDSGIQQKDLQSIIKNSMDMDLVDFVAKVIAKDAVVQVVGYGKRSVSWRTNLANRQNSFFGKMISRRSWLVTCTHSAMSACEATQLTSLEVK